MSKFLYPIYKLKTKSYIKWWLYHKKAGGSGILSEILQGFSFNLENTLNRKFNLFEIEGNSVQDGSPSPDNEVPIKSAGDNGSINEKIQNKNWNTSPLQNGSLTNGLPDTNYETCRTTNFIDIKPSTNYAFSINGILNRVVVSMYDKDKNFIATDGAGGYVSSNGLFTTYANAYYIKYRAYNADKQLFLNGNIQIEQGTTATSYVPHEEQDYSIFVQQPMRSIGDVRDCFVKKDGNWYERHYISKVILDGTEPWSLRNNCFIFNISDIKPTPNYADRNQLITISNYYIAQTSEYRTQMLDLRVCKTIDDGTPKQVAIKDTSKTLAEFKAWLAEKYANGNPVYIDYILETPLDLPCTSEQIEALENLPSTYKDFTIIQSEDETSAHLKIQYYKEG